MSGPQQHRRQQRHEAEFPHNVEAEQACLASAVVDGIDGILQLSGVLRPEDFYRDVHVHVFRALLDLAERSIKFDVISIADAIVKTGALDRDAARCYAFSLVDSLPSSANLLHWAKIVKDCSIRRRMVEHAVKLRAMALKADVDPAELAAFAENGAFEAAHGLHSGADDRTIVYKELAAEGLRELEKRMREGTEFAGVPTGLRRVDAILHGMKAGELIVIAARPSMGKSTLLLTLIRNAAKAGHRVAFLSLEMERLQVDNWLTAAEGRIDSTKLQTGRVSDADWMTVTDAKNRMWDMPLALDDGRGLTVSQVKARLRRMRSLLGGIDLICVDYLQLIRPDTVRRGGTREQEVAEVATALRSLAGEYGCPLVTLAQLSREVERRADKRPLLSDLRESGQIEQDADVVAFLYRDSYYERQESTDDDDFDDSDEPLEGAPDSTSAAAASSVAPEMDEVEFIVGKQRGGQQNVFCKLAFFPQFNRMDDLETYRNEF